MRTLNCPRCSEPMQTRTVGTGTGVVLIDICDPGCAGIWLDEQDMSAGLDVTDDLQQAVLSPCRTPDCGQPAPCPICQEPMQRYRWNYTSPVVLDQCPAGHGTWIDAGEVQAMEEFEERETIPDEQRVKLRARLGMDRLEGEASKYQGVGRSPSHLYTLVELVWRRFL
jgi:Zn-finger nucleic acid-binding protein